MKKLLMGLCAAAVSAVGLAETTLPEGYVKLVSVRPGFVQWQYVDTGFTPSSTDKIEIDVTFENADRGGAALWCARNSSMQEAACLFWEGSSVKKLTIDCGNNSSARTAIAFTPKNDERFLFVEDCNARTFSINGEVVVSSFAAGGFKTDSAGGPIVLFAARSGASGTPSFFSYGTYAVHSFKVTGADSVVKLDLVPAFEKATGIAGFYDTVGGRFITCSGYDKTKSPSLSFVAGDAFGNALPPKFSPVSWVSGVGNQALTVFMRPLSTDTIEAKVQLNSLAHTFCFWCARGDNSVGSTLFSFNSDKTFTVDCGNSTKGSGRYGPTADYIVTGSNYEFKVDYKARKFYVDGIEKQSLGNVSFTQGGSDLRFFGGCASAKRTTEPSNPCNGGYRLYGAKVTGEDGTVKLDLVPCLEEASEIAGLYDRISGRFMKAMCVDQVPSFSYGIDDVPVTYTECEWVRAPGTQWIHTDLIPRGTDTIEMKLRFSSLDSSATLWCARGGSTVFSETHCICCFNDPKYADYKNSPMLTIDRDERTLAPYAFDTETDYTLTEDCSNSVFYVNGVRLTRLSTAVSPEFDASGYLSLFAAHQAGLSLSAASSMTTHSRGRYRVYSFKVTDKNGNLKADMRPAVRDTDGVAGLYDHVRKGFFPFIGTGAEAGTDTGNRWTLCPTVEPLAWTVGATPTLVAGAALHGTVVCSKTAAELAALAPGEHEVVFSVTDGGDGMALEKRVTVTVSAAPSSPVYPSAPFELRSFSRRTGELTLAFGASAAERSVYLAWSARDAGADFLAYGTNVCKLCTVPAGETQVVTTVPAATLAAMQEGGFRIFLSGAKPTSSDYVSEGLVAHYDAIDNAGRGQHADVLSTWKNLGSGENLDLPLENSEIVGSDFIRLVNLAHQTAGDVLSDVGPVTLEADVVPFYQFANGTAPRSLLWIWRLGRIGFDPVSNGGLCVASPTTEDTSGRFFGQSFPSGLGTISQLVSKGQYQTYAAIPAIGDATTNSLAYVNGVEKAAVTVRSIRENSIVDSFKLQVGYSMAMYDCHVLRVYNRALSASELVRNARVDAERFGRADCLLHAQVTEYRKVRGGMIIFVK